MSEERATVDRLADAQVGDTIWVLKDCWRRPYQWGLNTIIATTRVSVQTVTGGFLRRGGASLTYRGYTPPCIAFGQAEYEAFHWRHQHFSELLRAVEACRDLNDLKEIARIVGYDWKELRNG